MADEKKKPGAQPSEPPEKKEEEAAKKGKPPPTDDDGPLPGHPDNRLRVVLSLGLSFLVGMGTVFGIEFRPQRELRSVDFLSNLPTIELAGLIRELEGRWGVCGHTPVGDPPGPVDMDEQTEFTVTLTDVGTNKIQVIKSVRQTLGLGLKEAKDLVESVPKLLKEGISKIEAAELQAEFEAAGAKVDVR